MNLKLYKNTESIVQSDFKSLLKKINFYSDEQTDVGVFHYNEISDNIYHIVFYINEEYRTQSRYIKDISSIPMNIYINTFIFLDKGLLFVENIYEQYCELVKEKLNQKFSLLFVDKDIAQCEFKDIIINKSKKILKCEFDIDEILVKVESRDKAIELLQLREKVYYMNFTIDIESYTNILISMRTDGLLNINTNIPLVLVNIIDILMGDN